MRNSEGDPLVKRLLFKCVQPSGKISVMKHVAPAGQGFGEDNIDAALEDFAKLLEITFPKHDFRMVEISRTQFNFVCCGERYPFAEIVAEQDIQFREALAETREAIDGKPATPEYETLGQNQCSQLS